VVEGGYHHLVLEFDMQKSVLLILVFLLGILATIPFIVYPEIPTSKLGSQQPQTPARQQKTNRVAICFFGIIKTLNITQLQSYEQAVFLPLKKAGFELDGYLHTSLVRYYSNARWKNLEAGNIALNQTEGISLFSQYINFSKVEIGNETDGDRFFGDLDQYLTHGDPWRDNPRLSALLYLRQLHSILRVTMLWGKRTDDYFGAVYVRSDLEFRSQLNVGAFRSVCGFSGLSIGIPAVQHGGFDDRFAFGNGPSMQKYGQRGLGLLAHSKKSTIHAEKYLAIFLCMNKFEVHIAPISHLRIRSHRATPDGGIDSLFNNFHVQMVDWKSSMMHALSFRPPQQCAPYFQVKSVWRVVPILQK